MTRNPSTPDPSFDDGPGRRIEHPQLRQQLNRRRFLGMLGSAGALGAVGCSAGPGLRVATTPPDHRLDADADDRPLPERNSDRTLVVIELQGGNDGLATLQPVGDGRLRDVRPGLVTDDSELIDAGGGFGWHPNLAGLAGIGTAAVVGVGSNEPDFSHFEMEQRWWRGESGERSRLSTGFFGRLCDELDVGAPVTGISLSGGPSPALASNKAVTVGLTDPGANWIFKEEDPWLVSYRGAVEALSTNSVSDNAAFTAARKGLADMTSFSQSIARMEDYGDDRYPWTDLGQQLRFASEIMALDVGVRVLHVRLGGFDTHTGQSWRHAGLMNELGEATTVFVDHLAELGLRDTTLVATTSEFGRRVEQNDGGTDHGGASTMMMCGPGTSGVHGEAPNLGSLDDGNVVATARFEDYYATLAEDWFGVRASDVLPSGGDPITGILTT